MNPHISERTLEILEWPLVQRELISRCASGPGKKTAESLIPLSVEQSGKQLKKISGMKELISTGHAPDFTGVEDIEGLLVRANKDSVLGLGELITIKNFAAASAGIKHFLEEHRSRFPVLGEEWGKLDRLGEIGDILRKSITETGELNEHRFPALGKIRAGIFSARHEIENRLIDIIHSPSVEPALQEKIFTTRGNRYVLLVKANMKSRVRGSVQDVSATGSSFYIEPEEINSLNTSLILLEAELQNEIRRILAVLTREVGDSSEKLSANLKAAAYIDFLSSAALFSRDIRCSEPEIADEPVISLRAARHPVLAVMIGTAVVANDIELGKKSSCLIISGANTGGKTVLLKTAGLCCLMALYGLHIPAGADSRIGLFSKLYADIGDDQNLSRSLSTFSGQIGVINEIICEADERTLAIMDEIVVGTNPRQGAALAQAILEDLIATGCRIIVTTHYTELKEMALNDSRFRNASMSFDPDGMRPTYRLADGIPGSSHALEIATQCGIHERIIARSRELVGGRELSIEALMEKIQKNEEETAAGKEKIREMNERLSALILENEHREKELKRKKSEIERLHGIEFLEELGEFRNKVSDRIRELHRAGIRDAEKIREEIRECGETVSRELQHRAAGRFDGLFDPFDPETVNPGDEVFIGSLEKRGVIESVDRGAETAAVILGGAMRSQVRFSDLFMPKSGVKKPAGGTGPARGTAAAARDGIPVTLQTNYNTVDLRGMRVDEALAVLDRDLDRMMRGGIDAAVIIHGHGTGALKDAVRKNLGSSFYAEEFRPGGQGEGGDGVTIVKLAR